MTATKVSGQNDAASRTSTTYNWEHLVLVVVLVLESKAFYCTVEPRLTATSVYGHLVITATFLARQNGHTFPYKKKPLIPSPVNRANDHILKSQTVETSIISPR